MRFRRRDRVPDDLRPWVALQPGERILAWGRTTEGWYAVATTRALQRRGDDGEGVATPYVDVLSARWEPDSSTLELVEAGPGTARRRRLRLDDAGFLPETVRERVQASIIASRRVALRGKRGATVVARRAPDGDGPVVLQVSYDAGVDGSDPAIAAAVEQELAGLRDELGG